MDTNIYQLDDNRVLGVNAFEIMSFPSITAQGKNQKENCEKLAKDFSQLTTELYKLCGSNTVLEFLWVAEKVVNQTFSSKIRIFGVVRKIGADKNQVCYELDNIQKNFKTTLSSWQFNVVEQDLKSASFTNVIASVEDSCVYSIVKSEKCIVHRNSVYPYYFTEIVPGNNVSNFNSLIATLSQYENCCISFQLFSTNFTQEEAYILSEMSAELGRIVTGTTYNKQMYKDALAAEPLKALSYYNERINSPMFLYNILVFGERSCCANLAAKTVSLLQSGENKVVSADFKCIDLTNEKIKLTSQFPHYVWNINRKLLYNYRNVQLQKSVRIAQKLFRLPYIMSVEEVNSFFRLPLYEASMTSLKSNQLIHAREQFDNSVVGENNIIFGHLAANENYKISIGCPEKSFTKHALVVGTPGSGKTTFSVNLLLQFFRKNIPFLAIEPTKTEYRAMIDAIPNLRIFTPGNNDVSPFIINPFIPPKGIRIEQYIPSLASAFKAAFSMPSPLDMIFLKAIRTCYIQHGWKDYSRIGDEDVKLFGLQEFILVFKELLDNTNYSKEIRGNLESAGLLRLTNLIEQNSNIYDTINTVPIEDLLTAPTILELNSIDNAEQKSLIIALLLINICIYTKHNNIGDGELKNAILIDEAHVLLGGGSTASDGSPSSQETTVKALQDMIAEIRSYGTSIIIADQSPTKVSREIVANTDIKVSFRLVQSIEKDLIADSANMNEEAKNNLSRLKPGEAYVYYSKLDMPQMIITEDIREKEGIRLSVSNQEVKEKSTYWDTRKSLLIPYAECEFCEECVNGCDFNIRSNAEFISNSALNKYRPAIKSVESFRKCVFHLPNLMAEQFDSYSHYNIKKLQMCTRIKLIRKVALEQPFKLSEREKKQVVVKFPEKTSREGGEI